MKRISLALLVLVLCVLGISILLFATSAKTATHGNPLPSLPPQSQPDELRPIPRLIREAKSSGAVFKDQFLFHTTKKSVSSRRNLATVLFDGSIVQINRAAITELLARKPDFVRLPLPTVNGVIHLELRRVDPFSEGFSVKTSAPSNESLTKNLGVHYRGVLEGDDASVAAISVFEHEVMGFFSDAREGNHVVGRIRGVNDADEHVVFREADLQISPSFFCQTKDVDLPITKSAPFHAEDAQARCVRIYIEANYDLFLNKGNVANTTSYVTGVFNQSATLFANDGVPVSLSEVFVWNSPSPYSGTDSVDWLETFRSLRPSFNGDLAHLLSIQSGLGGIAYVSGLCTSARYAFSAIDTTFNLVPTYSWSVEVFTHETGHNLGSRHTHACAWNGDNTAIDGCHAVEGSCPQPGLPADGGTIMSYCHLTSAGINFALGFGPQPRALIVNRFNTATCLQDCTGGCIYALNPQNRSLNSSSTSTFVDVSTGSTCSWSATVDAPAPLTAGEVSKKNQVTGSTLQPAVSLASWINITSASSGTGSGRINYTVSANTSAAQRTGSIIVNGQTHVVTQVGIAGPANDNFSSSLVILGMSGSVSGTNLGATKEVGEPAHGGNTGGKSVWYRWQAPTTGTATLTTAGSDFDTLLGVYLGSAVNSLSTIAGNDDDPGGGLTSRVTFATSAGSIYRIAVDGWNSDSGSITLNWTVNGPPGAPIANAATNVQANGFTANWSSSSAATGYRLDVATDSNFSSYVSGYQDLNVGNVLAWSVTGLSPGTYYYRVRAYNSDGPSGNSNVITVAGSQFTITVTAAPTSGGTVNGGGNFAPGSSRAVTASPNSGFVFVHWTEGAVVVSTSATYTFTLNSNRNLVANFASRPAGTNLALALNGAIASASSTLDSGRAPVAAINGDRKGSHWGTDPSSGSGWHDANTSFPDSLQIDFSATANINEIDVYSLQDNYINPFEPGDSTTFSLYGLTGFSVQYWTGSAWSTVPGGSVSGNNLVKRRFIFASPISTSRIRVLVNSALANYSRITEVEAWGTGGVPPPSPRVNVALASRGGVATASSTLDSGRLPLAVINDDRRGVHWGTDPATGSGWHDATSNNFPDSVQINFSGSKAINEIDVYTIQDNYLSPVEPNDSMTFSLYGIKSFDVQYWTGASWTTVPNGNVVNNNLVKRSITFSPIVTDRIRVLVNNGQAGYSRIVEVEAWSPVINVALASNGGVASASTTLDGGRAALAANNGDRKGIHWGTDPATGSGWHDAGANTYPDWLQIDFSGSKTITEIDVFTLQDNYTAPVDPTDSSIFSLYGITAFEVQYWTGTNWITVPGGSVVGSNKVKRTFNFAPITTDRIRVFVNSALAGYSRIVEIEAY